MFQKNQRVNDPLARPTQQSRSKEWTRQDGAVTGEPASRDGFIDPYKENCCECGINDTGATPFETASRVHVPLSLHATGECHLRARDKPEPSNRELLQLLPWLDEPQSQRAAQQQHRMQHVQTTERAKLDHQQREQEPAERADHHEQWTEVTSHNQRVRPTAACAQPPVQDRPAIELANPTPTLVPCPRPQRH